MSLLGEAVLSESEPSFPWRVREAGTKKTSSDNGLNMNKLLRKVEILASVSLEHVFLAYFDNSQNPDTTKSY